MIQFARPLLVGASVLALAIVGNVAELPKKTHDGSAVFKSRDPKIVGAEAIMAPPSPKEDISVTVELAITFDPGTQLYTYTYTVTNRNSSKNALDEFGVGSVPRPVDVAAPAHWKGFYGWEDRTDVVVWTVWDGGGTKLPADTTGTWDVTVSPYSPQPGTTLTGFTITTHQPPAPPTAPVTFYAQGFDTLLDVGQEPEDASIPSQQTLWVQSVQGQIGGPDVTSTVGVSEGQKPSNAAKDEFRAPTPNPARTGVALFYYLPRAGNVRLAVHDIAGRQVAVLANGRRPAGLHSVSWDGLDNSGRPVGSGVFFSTLVVDGQRVGDRKITILK